MIEYTIIDFYITNNIIMKIFIYVYYIDIIYEIIWSPTR
jgi:hypothetical protein